MGGGGTKIVQPQPPPQPTAAQSAKEFAAALPTILETQLRFQPEFDRATFESFQELGPEFARVARETLSSFAPTLASLDEELSQQALELSEQGLSESARDLFREEFKALAGNQVNSGLGADFVARNLVREQLAAQQQGRNLGLAIQGKVSVQTAFQQPSQFQVANAFQPAFGTQTAGFGSVFSGAGRPQQVQKPDFLGAAGGILQGVGGIAQGVGSAGGIGAFFCWVASEIFGGWNHPKTCATRLYIDKLAPKWFKSLYIKHGKTIANYISNKPLLKLLLRPLFEVFALIGEQYGRRTNLSTA